MTTWISLFLIPFLIGSAVLSPILRWNLRRGHVDRPAGRKDHRAPVPYGGGLAAFVTISVCILGGLVVAFVEPTLPGDTVFVQHLEGARSKLLEVLAILLGACGMLVTGRIDDARGLSVKARLLVQIVAAAAVFAAGPRITAYLPWSAAHCVLTVGWIVFVTNAYNFIDNMDGLLPGSATAAALAMFAYALLDGQLFVAAFALVLAGALAAVWVINRAPARVYMGDEGSLFTGFLLATLTVVISYRGESGSPGWVGLPLVVPFVLVGATAADGVVTITARVMRGVSPWTAGHDHLSHRLARRGFGSTGAVRVLVGASFVAGGISLLLPGVDQARVLAALPFFFVAAMLFAAARSRTT